MKPSDKSRDHGPCCVASRAGSPQDVDLYPALRTPPAAGAASKGKRATSGMVRLEGGEFLMGTDDRVGFPADGEGPVRAVVLKPFWIDPVAVSNERFAAFVDATGYVTDAERYGWSFVFEGSSPRTLSQREEQRRPLGGARFTVQTGVIRRVLTPPLTRVV